MASKKDALNELAEKLKRQEAKKFLGAPSRTPKSRMLDASPLEQADPEHHYLYVNTEESGNLQGHLDDGYQAVPDEECRAAGVRQRVGELVLMRVPRQRYEEMVQHQREVARQRLEAHRAEYRGEIEAVVRELRDRGYSNHDLRRLLVDES